MKVFELFCADCTARYEQTSERKPYCCGVCGSKFIALKVVEDTDAADREANAEMERNLCTPAQA